MARTFYTEQDIADLARRGVKEIEVNDNVYLTDLAREKMEALSITAKKAAPRRAPAAGAAPAAASGGTLTEGERQQVFDQVRSGVLARLGPGVDVAMVDTIVGRVVSQL